jgi:orotate phosphoribosyltransferase
MDRPGFIRGFVEFMIESGVLTFGDFVTKGGRNTPYFINTGNYKTGSQLATLGDYYAMSIMDSGEEFQALFGPAYKGIPLAAAAAVSLYRLYGRDAPYLFNRKEAKDHGEGGVLVGYRPKPGDKVAIVEDVVTAGTSVRESVGILSALEDVAVTALYVSADRMETGTGDKTALDELRDEFGIRVYPIVTARDIIAGLPAGDPRALAMEEHLRRYGSKNGVPR